MKKLVRIFALLGSLLLMSLLPLSAKAVTPYTCAAPIVVTIDGPASINIKDNNVNEVLWERRLWVNMRGGENLACAGNATIMYTFPSGLSPVMNSWTYPTGIGGIGYQITSIGDCDSVWPVTCGGFRGFIGPQTINIKFVRTGPILESGKSWSGVFGRLVVGNNPVDFLQYAWSAPILVTVRPAVLQCTTTTPQVTLPMGSIPKTAFSGIGSTTGAKPLNIDLTCSGGDPGDSKAISVTLTDNTNPANRSTTLSLTPQSVATGVGIQVLTGATVIGYGADSNQAGNPGQWSAGSSGAGVFRIPLSARYIQTGATITPGSANGRATFTMSYQ